LISVVVVNWNAGPLLERSVTSALSAADVEVIVVDNASADGSVDTVVDLDGVTLIRNRRNRGLAAALNQGALAATGDPIIFLNPDATFSAGGVQRLCEAIERRPRAGAVVPRVRFTDGEVQTTAGELPSLREALAGRQRQWRGAKWGNPSGFCWDGWAHDEERQVGRAGDVCFAVRREAFAATGLFDERFPLDWEAVDWSARLVSTGWEIWFTPDVELVHDVGTSTGRANPLRWVAQTHLGMYRYFANRSGPVAQPVLAVLFGVRAIAKAAAALAGLPMHERAQRPARR
jgi:N-acetylglucosaminyl-diphospho-decaprenol L-rhamnosyltransferase